jgi:hypothetical protein
MSTTRFAISYDAARLATVVGAGPHSSGVEVDPDEIRVRMGPDFRLDIPRGRVRSVKRSPDRAEAGGELGVHGGWGRWLVTGSSDGLVELTIEPPCYSDRGLSTLFRKVKVSSLILSLVDPDGFIAALEPDGPT